MLALKAGSALSNPEDEVADTARQNVRSGTAHLTGSATSIGARNGGTRALILDQPGFNERDQTTGSARDRIDYVLVKSGFEDGLRPLRLAGSGTHSLPVITLIFSRATAWGAGSSAGVTIQIFIRSARFLQAVSIGTLPCWFNGAASSSAWAGACGCFLACAQ